MSPISGGDSGGVPPLPIPNREVKPACADGTAMQCGRVGGCLLYLRSSRSNDFGDLFLCPYISYFLLFPSLFLDIACAEHYLCPCYTLLYSSVLWLVYIPFLIHQHNDVMSFSVCRPYYHAPYIIIYVHYIIYIAFYF